VAVPKVVVVSCDNPTLPSFLDAITSRGVCDCYTFTTSVLESALPDFSCDSGPPEREPLNIVVLYPDDWRPDSLHMAGKGNPYVRTPFLDELAEKGVRFWKYSVTTSLCWVSRATLWTGQYAGRHGVGRSIRLRSMINGTRLIQALFVSVDTSRSYWEVAVQKPYKYHR
jgi:hypothetical protein